MKSKQQLRDPILDGVKGLLLLFIILEHNTLLTAQESWIRPLSDAFAAGCFLIFIFIWPLKKISIKQFFNKHFSYLIPFIVFTSVTTLANSFLYANQAADIIFINYLQALFLASPLDLKIATGFMYLWFLPCLSFLYLTRLLHQKIGDVFLLLPFLSFLLLGLLPEEELIATPYAFHVIGFIYILGVAYEKLHPKLMALPQKYKALLTLLFLALLMLSADIGWQLFIAGGILPSFKQPFILAYYALTMLIAIPSFYFLLSLMPQVMINSASLIGKESLKIYLIHPIVFILISKIFPLVTQPLLSFIATIVLSLIIALIINKITLLNKLIFPITLSALFKRN